MMGQEIWKKIPDSVKVPEIIRGGFAFSIPLGTCVSCNGSARTVQYVCFKNQALTKQSNHV